MMEVPEFPKKLILGLQEGVCNLRCPRCYVHNAQNRELRTGMMPLENLIELLEEVKDARPRVAPQTWDEPLMNKDIIKYLGEIAKRDLPITMDTNGLLITDKLAGELVDIGVDSIFISVDAVTPETLMAVRGVKCLDKIHEAVFRLLKARGEGRLPRIGVSFTVDEFNIAEKDQFVEYWIQHVDVIRVGERYLDDRKMRAGVYVPEKRTPCWSLYDTMMVLFNGDATICCLDVFGKQLMGNVFEYNVRDVWHGPGFSKARELHEAGKSSELSLCAPCEVWSHYQWETEDTGELLIRRTPAQTFYNRKDKLTNLNFEITNHEK